MADFNKSSPSSGKLRTTLTAAANFASRPCLSSSCAMPSPLKDDMKESSHLEQEIDAINEKKKKKSERAEGRGWHSLFTTAPCWHLSCICKRPAAFSLIWDFEMKLFYKITLVVFFRSAITDYILRVKCIFLWFICSLTIKFTLAGKIIISLARCLSAICSKKANLLRSRMSQTRNVWALNTSGWCSFIQ